MHGIKWVFFDIGSTLVDETECEAFRAANKGAAWPSHLEKPYPGAAEVLEELRGRYRLGVIANQLPGARLRLENYGLLKYFDVIASSAEEGVSKPDAEIFLRALARAGCRPGDAAMVGDRMDNDVAPAKTLGMTAVWVRQGRRAQADVAYDGIAPDIIIYDIRTLTRYL